MASIHGKGVQDVSEENWNVPLSWHLTNWDGIFKFPFTLTLTPLPSLYKVCSKKKNNSVRIKTSFILVYFGSMCPMADPDTFWWGAEEFYSQELPLAYSQEVVGNITRSKALKACSSLSKKHRMIQLIGMMIQPIGVISTGWRLTLVGRQTLSSLLTSFPKSFGRYL